MEYIFKSYKHKHLMLLKEKWGNEISKYLLYSLNNVDTRVGTKQNNKNIEPDLYIIENKDNLNDPIYELNYSNIFNMIQYSSICISIFVNNNKNETKDNIVGIISIDHDLLPDFENEESKSYLGDNKLENTNYFDNELSLDDFYYSLSLYIKKYNIVSNLNSNNTLIINLVITDNTNYYDDLFFYLFNEFEDIFFILIFLKTENNIEKMDISKKGIIIDLDNLNYDNVKTKSNLKYNKIFIINKNMFVNKIYIRPTTSSDIYDLHELFKKYLYQPEKESNKYLVYDIIENKTENDILISILNSREKIVGFVWLKKNIDINILVNLYNLKKYNYLIKQDLFSLISSYLMPYKDGDKLLNRMKKKYLFVEFKQYILKSIKIESVEDLEKKYEIDNKIIYDYLSEHLIKDVDSYFEYFKNKNLNISNTIKNIYNKMQYDYENIKSDGEGGSINFFQLNKLINLYAHISFADISKVSKTFYDNFEKIEILYFNFNNDKTYKKIYENIKKKKEGLKCDDLSENNTSKMNIIKLNYDSSARKTESEFTKVVNLSYYDIFLLLQNIYPDIFKTNEIILLFLFLDLYEIILVTESTIFDCVSFKTYLDELININKNYFIYKYKHIDWLSNLCDSEKNAYSLNLFVLNDKYYSNSKDILLKIEKIFFKEVDYIIATNNERGYIPFILNYFNRIKKKKKANTLESLYILNKYTLFLPPSTDYMKISDIKDVQDFLKSCDFDKKNEIFHTILSLKEYCKSKLDTDKNIYSSDEHIWELNFYREQNYYIFVSRSGNNIINVTSGRILNNLDFYYKNKIYDFKNIIVQNENKNTKHFLMSFFSSIIIFKYYDKAVIHNILRLTKACSCHVEMDDNKFRDVYKHFKILRKKNNKISILKKKNICDSTKCMEVNKEGGNKNKYLIITKQMCSKKSVNIDNNLVFWGLNDLCLCILYKILKNNEYLFNNIILIIRYKNKYLCKNVIDKYNNIKNISLDRLTIYNKLKNIMTNDRIKIIYDNVYSIDRENKKLELSQKKWIYYDYLFLCFDKEDITTYSFDIDSYQIGKKKNFNFLEQSHHLHDKNGKLDFLVKAKDYEKYEDEENRESDETNECLDRDKDGQEEINNGVKKYRKKKNEKGYKNYRDNGDELDNEKEKENYTSSESSDIYDDRTEQKNKIFQTTENGEKNNEISKTQRGKNSDKYKGNDPEMVVKNEGEKDCSIQDYTNYSTPPSSCFDTSEESSDSVKDISTNGKQTKNLEQENGEIKKEEEKKKKSKKNKRSINGVFSISDPMIEKHFDEKSEYMKIVKNCVNYIVIYSNNLDILSMVNFFLKNKISTYKLIIICPYSCNKCDREMKRDNKQNDGGNIKDYIFKERGYYKNKEHLKNNYIFLNNTNYSNNYYHKNYVLKNIKYVLNKIFFLFHLLKIRIIYGKIIAIKKNKDNKLKNIIVHFCKHKKTDQSFINSKNELLKNVILLPCQILLSSYNFDMNNHVNYILRKSSIVYNKKICLNHNFQTNDKFIFSGGDLCAFSNKYRISKNSELNHEYYNSVEIGKLASRQILKIVIDKYRIPYNVLKLKNKNKQIEKYEKNGSKTQEKNILETDKPFMEKIQDKENECDDIFYHYKKLKVFEKPFVYFNKLPCDFYFYYFQASNGDLCKYNNWLAPQTGEENIKPNNNDKNDNSEEIKKIYNNAFCTDTLKISIKNEPELNEKFNVKYFDISKNIQAQGYYCRITTNSLNMINSFTYLGREKLNFYNLSNLCNLSINYFYTIVKKIKNCTSPNYDILSMMNEEREQFIFYYKFQEYKTKLKEKIINTPHMKKSIELLIKDIYDKDLLKNYFEGENINAENNDVCKHIKQNVQIHLTDYIKRNRDLLNGYYIPTCDYWHAQCSPKNN
ncbi:hypothetical protein YYE_00825 [Plasmodium vinckei vinckei]|nr:hypothetical protein YYE_00825 [Plasmodium vinckei vinckei]